MIELMNEILNVIGLGFLFGALFVFEPYNTVVEKYFNYKPFNCVLCLSFWCSLILYLIVGFNPVYAIYTAMLAEGTYRKLIS